MKRVDVHTFLQGCGNALLIDVRSPAEYKHAHIPGAVSLPLFTDEERAVVGTAYKQKSRQAAIKIGLDYFGPKMRKMVEEVEGLVHSRQSAANSISKTTADSILPTAHSLYIYCWRGGMRSGAVSWLLNLYGFDVTILIGGYKAYRTHVLQSFEHPYPFQLLGGYTGSGKTEVLARLKAEGKNVVCLESLASHKGSAFGNINMPPQPTQEMFENRLSSELQNITREVSMSNLEEMSNSLTTHHSPLTIWLEDESQRIGTVNIPASLWQQMRKSPIYFLDIPFEERLQHITEEYSQCNKEALANAIGRIHNRLGGLETKNALQLLEEGNHKESFRILLRYYDKHYLKGLHNRENLSSLLTKIVCETVTPANASLLSQPQTIS